MSNPCQIDDMLLTAYLEGQCTEADAKEIQERMNRCEDCRMHIAQLSALIDAMPQDAPTHFVVPTSVTQRAMSLFDTHETQSSALSIAIGFVGGLLSPLKEGLQPTSMTAAMVRGSAAREEELAYHVTLGRFSLAVELNTLGDDEIELSVQPTSPVPPGWTIRVIQGEQTRTVSSFNRDGIQVSSLGEGVYTVVLEHKQSREHQFHLRVVNNDMT